MTGSDTLPEPLAPGARMARILDTHWPALAGPGDDAPGLGVAVSGGGDSVALLLLVADWAAARGVRLRAVTVDHGLREGAAQEAEAVARLCAGLGIGHDILRWQGWDGQGNLQDAARRARQGLIAGWARDHGLAAVALGHTRDDQAETVLMRLARGAGVDGLSGMAPLRRAGGIAWLRPLLDVGRAELRALLRARGVPWAEDPSNEDARFQRVRARRALEALAPLGIGAEDMAATAGRMALARAALAGAAVQAAQRIARVERGDVLFQAAELAGLEQELRERLLAGALRWVASADYPPRRAALRRAAETVRQGRTAALHGCLLLPDTPEGWLRVAREHAAVADFRASSGAPWDGRWRLEPLRAAVTGGEVAALGEAGLQALKDRAERADCSGGDAFGEDIFAKKKELAQGGQWRRLRQALLALPAVWAGGRLLAVPVLRAGGEDAGWRLAQAPGAADFHASLLSH